MNMLPYMAGLAGVIKDLEVYDTSFAILSLKLRVFQNKKFLMK